MPEQTDQQSRTPDLGERVEQMLGAIDAACANLRAQIELNLDETEQLDEIADQPVGDDGVSTPAETSPAPQSQVQPQMDPEPTQSPEPVDETVSVPEVSADLPDGHGTVADDSDSAAHDPGSRTQTTPETADRTRNNADVHSPVPESDTSARDEESAETDLADLLEFELSAEDIAADARDTIESEAQSDSYEELESPSPVEPDASESPAVPAADSAAEDDLAPTAANSPAEEVVETVEDSEADSEADEVTEQECDTEPESWTLPEEQPEDSDQPTAEEIEAVLSDAIEQAERESETPEQSPEPETPDEPEAVEVTPEPDLPEDPESADSEQEISESSPEPEASIEDLDAELADLAEELVDGSFEDADGEVDESVELPEPSATVGPDNPHQQDPLAQDEPINDDDEASEPEASEESDTQSSEEHTGDQHDSDRQVQPKPAKSSGSRWEQIRDSVLALSKKTARGAAPVGAKILLLMSRPVAKLPSSTRDTIGWLGLYTGFLAVCVWGFLILFRKPVMPEPTAEAMSLTGDLVAQEPLDSE